MVQRIWRNKDSWLKSMIQRKPVLGGCAQKAIEITSEKQKKELKDIREKIRVYEANGCEAEKLTDTV